jgi:hypothetical protein
MGKYLTLVLAIPLLFSCAARKVAVTKTEIKTYTDSVSVEKKDSVSVKQNAIVIKESTDEVEVIPIDTSKPVIIGETKYYNAIVKLKKRRTTIVDSSKTIVAKTIERQVKVKSESTIKTKDKKIDKKANYLLYLWLLLIPIVVYVVRKYLLK